MKHIEDHHIQHVIGQAIVKVIEGYGIQIDRMAGNLLPTITGNIVRAFKAADDELTKIENAGKNNEAF